MSGSPSSVRSCRMLKDNAGYASHLHRDIIEDILCMGGVDGASLESWCPQGLESSKCFFCQKRNHENLSPDVRKGGECSRFYANIQPDVRGRGQRSQVALIRRVNVIASMNEQEMREAIYSESNVF